MHLGIESDGESAFGVLCAARSRRCWFDRHRRVVGEPRRRREAETTASSTIPRALRRFVTPQRRSTTPAAASLCSCFTPGVTPSTPRLACSRSRRPRLPSRFSPDPPRALEEAEIVETIRDFANGAARARDLGYDAVEVMASEGYLLNQFLSPLTNRREDAWGGDFERRMNFPRAVLRAIREQVGAEFPVIFRISGADLMADSTTAQETLAFARALAADGVDALNVGIGWHESSTPTVQHLVPSGVWVRYAAAVKSAVGDLPVIASNRINSLAVAEEVLAAGSVDFVSMARPFLADAEIVAKAARAEAHLVNTCIACNQACIDRSVLDEPVSCLVNPRAAREGRVSRGRRTRGAADVLRSSAEDPREWKVRALSPRLDMASSSSRQRTNSAASFAWPGEFPESTISTRRFGILPTSWRGWASLCG